MKKAIRFQTPNGQWHFVEVAELFVKTVIDGLKRKGYKVA